MAEINRKFDRQIKFRVTQEMERRLKAAAIERGRTLPEYLRQMTSEYLATAELVELRRYIQQYVAEAVEEKLEPVENRIAKITAKTANAAAMGMYVSAELLSLHHKDVIEIFRRARQKAIAFTHSHFPDTSELVAWGMNAAKDGEEQ